MEALIFKFLCLMVVVVSVFVLIPSLYWVWLQWDMRKSKNKSKFWSYQPICTEYTPELELILKYGEYIPQKYRKTLQLQRNCNVQLQSNNSNETFDFINKVFCAPEIKPYEYFRIDDTNRKYWSLKVNGEIVGAISTHYMRWIMNGIHMRGYYVDHLSLAKSVRKGHMAPLLIEVALDELNTKCLKPYHNPLNESKMDLLGCEWPVVIFKIDNEPLPHGQKYLAKLEYYRFNVEQVGLVSDVSDIGKNKGEFLKFNDIDWKKWMHVYDEMNHKRAISSKFTSVNDFSSRFGSGNDEIFGYWMDGDRKMLVIGTFSELVVSDNGNPSVPVFETHQVLYSGMEDGASLVLFKEFLHDISGKLGNGYVIMCDNGALNQFTSAKGFQKAHCTYLYMYNLNLPHQYQPKDVGLVLY